MWGLIKSLREIEWMVSLWTAATTSALFWIVVGTAFAMLTAIGTALYSFAAWINQFGAGGWVVAVVVAIFVSALIVGTVAWAWHCVRLIRSGRSYDAENISSKAAERELAADEVLRLIERSVFLLVSGAVDEGIHRKLWKAYQTIPSIGSATDDETLLRTSEQIKDYLFQVINDLVGTRLSDDLSTTLQEAKRNADAELRRAEVPTQFQPYIYREYFISLRQHLEIKGFLERAIANSDALREQTFRMLRDQKQFHEGRS